MYFCIEKYTFIYAVFLIDIVCTENRAEIENLSGSLKEEKQLRRKYEADLKVLQEESVELRDEKDNLEKVSMKWTPAKTLLDSVSLLEHQLSPQNLDQ